MDHTGKGAQLGFVPDGMSRREFIQGSAAVAAAFGVSLSRVAEAQERRADAAKDARPINVAFIGVGAQGYGVDFKRVMNVPGVKMVAVCDTFEPNLKRALKDVPNAKGYTDYRKLLEQKDIEAVLIATPLTWHAPIAIAALQAGKHVFSEKMMAYSIDDAKKMARAARDSKKILQIGHQRRSGIMYNHGWELLNEKKVCGQVTHIRAQWNRNGNWKRPVPKGSTERDWNWRLYKDLSQGLMCELGTHQIHVVNWYLNAKPTAVIGMGGIDYWKDGRTVFDNVEVIFEYPGGIKFNYTSLTTNQYDGFYEQFMGKNGTLIVSQDVGGHYYPEPGADTPDWVKASVNPEKDARGKAGLTLDPEATKKINKTGVRVGEKTIVGNAENKDDYQLEMEDFIASIRTGAKVTCSPEEGLACCVAAVRANEAMTKKTRIEIPASDYII